MYTVIIFSIGCYLGGVCLGRNRKKKEEEPKKSRQESQASSSSTEKPKIDTEQISVAKIKTWLNQMKVEMLQDMLRRTHAKVTGIKEDLVSRVLNEIKEVRMKKD